MLAPFPPLPLSGFHVVDSGISFGFRHVICEDEWPAMQSFIMGLL